MMARCKSGLVALLVFLTVVAPVNVRGISILGFAAISARSHQYCMLRIGQELAARGHKFTLVVSDVEGLSLGKLGSKAFPGLELVAFKGPPYVGTKAWHDDYPRDLTKALKQLQNELVAGAHHLHSDNAFLERLRAANYDVLLRDAMYWPASIFDDLLGIPSVEVLSAAPLQPFFGPMWSIPDPVAYLPQLGSGLSPNMGFLQRCQNYLQKVLIEQIPMRLTQSNQRRFMIESGLKVRAYQQTRSIAAAAISAADWAIEHPVPLPPKVHMVGPILSEAAKPLPADLAAFVESGKGSGHGAVYVSMGTAARLTAAELHSLSKSLSAIPNPVLWKLSDYDLPNNMTTASLRAPTIKFISFAPQNDVLGHPAVKAFVTHAGSNSIYEAAYHGMPVVCIPLVADQADNAARAEYHGFGLIVAPKQVTTSQALSQAIKRILTEPSFKANAVKVQKRLINKPRHPAQLAADVVERVVATGGEQYLETQMGSLSWWQLAMFDVKLALALAAVLLVAVAASFCWLVVRLISSSFKRVFGAQQKLMNQTKKAA